MRTSLTNRSTRTPTLAIASRRPMLVPYAFGFGAG